MKFRVTIRKEGKPDDIRSVEAPTRFAVYAQVRGDGGTVVSIEEPSRFWNSLARYNISIGTGVSRLDVIRTAKNLSTMLSAGLSLARALSIIERQSSNKRLKVVTAELTESIKKGSSFHEALALHTDIFPEIFVAMARAGEESGSLTQSLSIAALQMERSEELIRKIRGAMIYPAIVIIAVIIVAVLMLMYVVPTLTKTFTSLGVEVPLATRIIVALSNAVTANGFVTLSTLALLIFGSILFVRSRLGSRVVTSVALRLPMIGELVRETYSARAARTLSSLLSASVPVLEALVITKGVVHAPVFAKVIEEAETHVRKGEPLSASFSAHTNLYPILMSDMLAVGEETGQVAEMLKQIAEFYETDVAEKTKDLSTIIEPVLMLLIGTVVGVFAVSMIAPIYQLSSAL